jgi:hypothetical protein
LVIAAVLLVATALPIFSSDKAAAYGLVTSREIKMSSSANGATDTTYDVSFIAATTSNVGGLVIDFCSNTPIIGDSCTAPTGFDTNEAGLALANQSGVTDWVVNAATTTNKVVLTRTAASVTASTTVSFDLGAAGGSDGITNPTTTNTTFYARILTFSTNAGATGYTSTSPGAEPPLVDAGGVALSTAAQIIVTAKVPERLLFCVYTTGSGNDCTTKSGTAVSLGNTNGVLDPAGPYVDKNAKFSITTNAVSGAIVRVKGPTLTTGSNTITAIGGTPTTSTLGTEQFGLCAYTSAGPALTVDTVYDGGSGSECSSTTQTAGTGSPGGAGSAEFAFDTNTTDGTGSTFGDTLATKAVGSFSTGILVFVGNISDTTEPGIYTSTLTFVATGTY